jgi:hypothetical protein
MAQQTTNAPLRKSEPLRRLTIRANGSAAAELDGADQPQAREPKEIAHLA